MRDVHILQELLAQQCPEIHKKRLNRLLGNTHFHRERLACGGSVWLLSRRVGSATFKPTPFDTGPCCHRSGSVRDPKAARLSRYRTDAAVG
ncbi:hypothetical protein LY04_00009 [Oceanimonas baumannii]|uniref:Uncharacterized protein n=1 Tax=Oceanimonas baumannii TaxID=129578 RepID=A0ABY2F283_9GAMM|nr:hypothetical protein LY04_00009 [Oceanimonas baumannii]